MVNGEWLPPVKREEWMVNFSPPALSVPPLKGGKEKRF